jgi:hypothetical protein
VSQGFFDSSFISTAVTVPVLDLTWVFKSLGLRAGTFIRGSDVALISAKGVGWGPYIFLQTVTGRVN